MSNEIAVTSTPGATLYAVVRVGSRHAAGATLEAFDPAHWTTYARTLAELSPSTGRYATDFPALAVGVYTVEIYEQAGASPALADDGLPLYEGTIEWDGTAEVALASRLATADYTAPDNAALAAVKARTDNLPDSPAAVGSMMTISTSAFDAVRIGDSTLTQVLQVLAACAAGNVTTVRNADGSITTTITDFLDGGTVRLTARSTSTGRTVSPRT